MIPPKKLSKVLNWMKAENCLNLFVEVVAVCAPDYQSRVEEKL
jgi:hypothetical protein